MSDEGKKKKKSTRLKERKEISKLLNQVLETDIAWHKLSIEDLTQIVNLFTNPDELYERLKKLQKEGFEEQEAEEENLLRKMVRDLAVKAGVRFVEKWDGPIITYLRELLKS